MGSGAVVGHGRAAQMYWTSALGTYRPYLMLFCLIFFSFASHICQPLPKNASPKTVALALNFFGMPSNFSLSGTLPMENVSMYPNITCAFLSERFPTMAVSFPDLDVLGAKRC